MAWRVRPLSACTPYRDRHERHSALTLRPSVCRDHHTAMPRPSGATSGRHVALTEEDGGNTYGHHHIEPDEHERSRIGHFSGPSQRKGNQELARQPLIATGPHVAE